MDNTKKESTRRMKELPKPSQISPPKWIRLKAKPRRSIERVKIALHQPASGDSGREDSTMQLDEEHQRYTFEIQQAPIQHGNHPDGNIHIHTAFMFDQKSFEPSKSHYIPSESEEGLYIYTKQLQQQIADRSWY
jgi:hypothetical protein